MNVLICNESNQWVGYDVKLNVILDINESDLVLAKFNYRTLPNYKLKSKKAHVFSTVGECQIA